MIINKQKKIRAKKYLRVCFVLAIFIFLAIPFEIMAAMSSQNYSIGSDTINSGGTPGSSTNFSSTGTLGEQAVGESNSANYTGEAGFWNTALSQGLGLNCVAANVYMVDYTLGSADNYSKHLFSSSEKCTITNSSATPWSLTASATNMTSAKNNLPNSNVLLDTDGNVGSGDTITSPTSNITEPVGPEYSLNSTRTVIQGTSSAIGSYDNQPTIKISNLNSLYNENLTGTITITLQ